MKKLRFRSRKKAAKTERLFKLKKTAQLKKRGGWEGRLELLQLKNYF